MACARRLFPIRCSRRPRRSHPHAPSHSDHGSPEVPLAFALRFSYCAKDTVRCSMRSNFFSSIVFSTQNLLQLARSTGQAAPLSRSRSGRKEPPRRPAPVLGRAPTTIFRCSDTTYSLREDHANRRLLRRQSKAQKRDARLMQDRVREQ